MIIIFILALGAPLTSGEELGNVTGSPKSVEELIQDSLVKASLDSLNYLIQVESPERNLTRYFYPGDIYGLKIAFERPSSDSKLDTIIFPAPQASFFNGAPQNLSSPDMANLYGFGYLFATAQNTYIVLIKNPVEKFKYFFLLAYAWNDSGIVRIEWDSFDDSQVGLNAEERELCQGRICQLPEYIFGTCPFVSRECRGFKSNPPTDPALLLKFKRSQGQYKQVISRERIKRGRPRRSPEGSFPWPNSYDLLLNIYPKEGAELTRERKSPSNISLLSRRRRSEHSTDLPNSIDLLTSVPSDDELPCNGCKRLGAFYSDLEEEPSFIPKITKALYAYWETSSTFEVRTIDAKSPYIGFGNCSGSPAPLEGRPSTQEEFISHYLSSIKVQCESNILYNIRTVLSGSGDERKVFEINENYTGFVNTKEKSSLLKAEVVAPVGTQLILDAIFFYEYVQVYEGQTTDEIAVKEPFRITRDIDFLTKLTLQLIDFSRNFVPNHFIKITQTLARLLKHKFYILLLERLSIERGGVTESFETKLSVNLNNLKHVMGIKEWLLYGLSDSNSSSDPFHKFLEPNKARIQGIVDLYLKYISKKGKNFIFKVKGKEFRAISKHFLKDLTFLFEMTLKSNQNQV